MTAILNLTLKFLFFPLHTNFQLTCSTTNSSKLGKFDDYDDRVEVAAFDVKLIRVSRQQDVTGRHRKTDEQVKKEKTINKNKKKRETRKRRDRLPKRTVTAFIKVSACLGSKLLESPLGNRKIITKQCQKFIESKALEN
ncbi:hypothetical protein V1477_010863 [Vespula maculifrons]|uniref:Uncharacterized protein n=1 Tax=Vespula maculifrons TaxID=7453 RepID=A0ABD2C394_VESMC